MKAGFRKSHDEHENYPQGSSSLAWAGKGHVLNAWGVMGRSKSYDFPITPEEERKGSAFRNIGKIYFPDRENSLFNFILFYNFSLIRSFTTGPGLCRRMDNKKVKTGGGGGGKGGNQWRMLFMSQMFKPPCDQSTKECLFILSVIKCSHVN